MGTSICAYHEIPEALCIVRGAADEGVSVDEFIAAFVDGRTDTCQASTRATYRAYLSHYAAWARAGEEADGFAPATLRAYLASRRSDSNATLRNRARYLRLFCAWLVERGDLAQSPFEGRDRVKMPAKKRARRAVWSEADIVAMLRATAPTQWKKGERKSQRQQWQPDGPMAREELQGQALVLLLVDSALRAAEACGLSCGQVRGARLLIRSKGGHYDAAFVSATTRAVLRELAGERPDTAPLFRDFNNRRCSTAGLRGIVQRLARRAGVPLPPRPVHAFRHYAARQWLKAGVPDLTIRQLMRHESLATTQIYTELDDEELAELHADASSIDRLMARAGLKAA
jgi:integrase